MTAGLCAAFFPAEIAHKLYHCQTQFFYKKNSELSQERKNKIRAQLVQCNNKHKEVFLKDYADWILREARGAMKLSRVARTILFTYCPFSAETMKALEGQTAYSEAAKKYIRDNRAARKRWTS